MWEPTTAPRGRRRSSSWPARSSASCRRSTARSASSSSTARRSRRAAPTRSFEQCALRGSKAYVAAHPGEVGELILLDYVANAGLQLPREANSDPELWDRLREAAAAVGAEQEFPAEGDGQFAIIDDHIPFVRAGVPSIDLIDFDYEYADTAQDTPDKLDPEALDAVGETVAELVLQLATEPAQP